MKRIRLNLSLRLLIAAWAFLLSPLQISKGCEIKGINFYGYDFYDINVVHPENGMAPYLLDIGEIYEKYVDAETTQIKGNLEEWRERFCDKAT
ncbi:MAG: hypothetical protein DWQ02_11030, partial [Bacteroidetes bacterium]